MTLALNLIVAIGLTICTIGLVINTLSYVNTFTKYAIGGPNTAIVMGFSLFSLAGAIATGISYYSLFNCLSMM